MDFSFPPRVRKNARHRILCSQIAFKPNDDGWGYTKRYASGWDRIFAKGDGDAPPAPTPQDAQGQDEMFTEEDLLFLVCPRHPLATRILRGLYHCHHEPC